MFHRFLRKIEREPGNPERRLVFADWLEELGHPAADGMRVLANCVPGCGNVVQGKPQWALFNLRSQYACSLVWNAARYYAIEWVALFPPDRYAFSATTRHDELHRRIVFHCSLTIHTSRRQHFFDVEISRSTIAPNKLAIDQLHRVQAFKIAFGEQIGKILTAEWYNGYSLPGQAVVADPCWRPLAPYRISPLEPERHTSPYVFTIDDEEQLRPMERFDPSKAAQIRAMIDTPRISDPRKIITRAD